MIARTCARIADSSRFQAFIMGVIVANAVDARPRHLRLQLRGRSLLTTLDDVFLGIFVVELAIRIAAFGRRPQDFFRDGWNVFDFVVIGARLHARASATTSPCCGSPACCASCAWSA